MDLHTTKKQPQWELVPKEKRNIFQKVAAATNGIVTPGNAISLAGALLSVSAVRDFEKGNNKRAVAKLTVGRILDIVDGKGAAATGTMSPLGEQVDAGLDKALAFFVSLKLAQNDLIPNEVAATFITQNVASLALSATAYGRGIVMHPSLPGKIGTGATWADGALFTIASLTKKMGDDRSASEFEQAALINYVNASVLGVIALKGYAEIALGPKPEDADSLRQPEFASVN